jgi:predicted  nucleic acid-binding Zn-ribbon protein
MSNIESEYNEALHELYHAKNEFEEAQERYKEAKAKFQHLDNEFKAHKDALAFEAEIAWSRKIKNPDF